MTRKFRKLTMSLVFQVFWDDNASVVKNAVFPGCSSLSAQTYSSLADVQKFITLKSFIVLWWKCSTIIVFVSRWDFPQSGRGFALTNCCSQSSQVQRWYRNFCFDVFLVDSRMPTCHGISTAWCGFYLMSVIALFIRRISSRWLHLWSLIALV
jgi:hypothetical protein